jgi:hypothetical protein
MIGLYQSTTYRQPSGPKWMAIGRKFLSSEMTMSAVRVRATVLGSSPERSARIVWMQLRIGLARKKVSSQGAGYSPRSSERASPERPVPPMRNLASAGRQGEWGRARWLPIPG